MTIKWDFWKRLTIDDEIFIDDNRFDDLIEIINLTFDNIIIRCLFNVFFIINVNMKKR